MQIKPARLVYNYFLFQELCMCSFLWQNRFKSKIPYSVSLLQKTLIRVTFNKKPLKTDFLGVYVL